MFLDSLTAVLVVLGEHQLLNTDRFSQIVTPSRDARGPKEMLIFRRHEANQIIVVSEQASQSWLIEKSVSSEGQRVQTLQVPHGTKTGVAYG